MNGKTGSTLAERIRAIQPSPTLAIDARYKELKAQGVDVISFGAGEPDYPSPDHVKEAAVAAIEQNLSHYTPVTGMPELRQAIARKLKRENGVTCQPGQILVTVGAKHALFNAFMALCNPGDEVIIPAPYWVSYPEQVRLAGAEPVIVPTDPDEGFRLTAAHIEPALTPRTRALVLNSPNNPSGVVYPPEDLTGIADLARRHDLWVISDEIYEHLVYDGARHLSVASLPGMAERTVLINGMSKAFAMTGWRIGYAVGPAAVIKAMADFQGHSTSNATSIAQAASIAALDGSQEPIKAMVADYGRRRDLVLSHLEDMAGITCRRPRGAFYVFAGAAGLMGRQVAGRTLKDTDDLAAVLLEEARVAVVPGGGFGYPDHIRLSYATATEELREGLKRMAEVLQAVE